MRVVNHLPRIVACAKNPLNECADEQRRLLDAFMTAAQLGDVAGLEGTLRVGCRRVAMHRNASAFELMPTRASAFEAIA